MIKSEIKIQMTFIRSYLNWYMKLSIRYQSNQNREEVVKSSRKQKLLRKPSSLIF